MPANPAARDEVFAPSAARLGPSSVLSAGVCFVDRKAKSSIPNLGRISDAGRRLFLVCRWWPAALAGDDPQLSRDTPDAHVVRSWGTSGGQATMGGRVIAAKNAASGTRERQTRSGWAKEGEERRYGVSSSQPASNRSGGRRRGVRAGRVNVTTDNVSTTQGSGRSRSWLFNAGRDETSGRWTRKTQTRLRTTAASGQEAVQGTDVDRCKVLSWYCPVCTLR